MILAAVQHVEIGVHVEASQVVEQAEHIIADSSISVIDDPGVNADAHARIILAPRQRVNRCLHG